MAFFLALASAALYGAGDFLGGLCSRRASTIAVVLVVQTAGLPLLALLLVLLPGEPSGRDLMWGAGAGVAGSAGLTLLYRGLAVGTMAIVAPITAVCAVVIPVAVSLLQGDRQSLVTLLGIGLALGSVALVGQERGPSRGPIAIRTLAPGIGLAVASGVAIGVFFLLLARTSPAAGLWPLVGARTIAVAFFTALAIGSRRSLRMTRPVAALAVTGGAIDMLANAAYLMATRYGSLSVVVTLASLYPASTVLLARLVLGERLNAWQTTGVLCALVAVALIVGG